MISRRPMRHRSQLAIGAALALLAAVAPASSLAAECANEAIRQQQGTYALRLPECRAYELVTPPDAHPNLQGGGDVELGSGGGVVELQQSTSSGSPAVAYQTYYPVGEANVEGDYFLSSRAQDGWSTANRNPPSAPVTQLGNWGHIFFSPVLSGEVLAPEAETGAYPEPPLVAGEPRYTDNLFLRQDGGPYSLVNLTPSPELAAEAVFEGASTDFGTVIFGEDSALTSGAPSGKDIYAWHEGALSLVSVLPEGTPVNGNVAEGQPVPAGSYAGFGTAKAIMAHSVSADGDRVVFEHGGALYLRENATQSQSAIVPASAKVNGEQCAEAAMACTIQLDAAASGAEGPGGGGSFWAADAETTRIFFTDEKRLTVGSTAAKEAPDLYEYDLAGGTLTDLTRNGTEPADVRGVVAVSPDGSYVYFVADGRLTGAQENEYHSVAQQGRPNLYVSHGGKTSYIATLKQGDSLDWGRASEERRSGAADVSRFASEVSADGQQLAFNSIGELTGYQNAAAARSECSGTRSETRGDTLCNEIFLYDAANGPYGSLSCPSCGERGVAPTGPAELRGPSGTYSRHALAADGSLFFDTPSKLVGESEHDVRNVYEWTPDGVAECARTSATYQRSSDGCLYLLTSGQGTQASYFAGASESGEDVYFLTAEPLLAADTDEGLSLYDARVGGGLAAQSVAPRQGETCASQEGCRPPISEPPVEAFGASAAFDGPSDLTPSETALKEPPPTAKHEGKGKHKLTRGQKLKRALKRCARKPPHRRAKCRKRARRRFARHRRHGRGRKHTRNHRRGHKSGGARLRGGRGSRR